MKQRVVKFTTVALASTLVLGGLFGCGAPDTPTGVPPENTDRTTDYFTPVNLGREDLLRLVSSLDDLNQLLSEKHFTISPMYDEAFFEKHALVLYFFVSSNYNELEITIEAENDHLILYRKYDYPGGIGLPLTRPWTFFIEVNKADIVGITEVKVVNGGQKM